MEMFLSYTKYIILVLTCRTLSLADLIKWVMALLWCSLNELNSSLQVKEDSSPILIKVWQSTRQRMWGTIIRKAIHKMSIFKEYTEREELTASLRKKLHLYTYYNLGTDPLLAKWQLVHSRTDQEHI